MPGIFETNDALASIQVHGRGHRDCDWKKKGSGRRRRCISTVFRRSMPLQCISLTCIRQKSPAFNARTGRKSCLQLPHVLNMVFCPPCGIFTATMHCWSLRRGTQSSHEVRIWVASQRAPQGRTQISVILCRSVALAPPGIDSEQSRVPRAAVGAAVGPEPLPAAKSLSADATVAAHESAVDVEVGLLGLAAVFASVPHERGAFE